MGKVIMIRNKNRFFWCFLSASLLASFNVMADVPPHDNYRCSTSNVRTTEVIVGVDGASAVCGFPNTAGTIFYVSNVNNVVSIIGCSGFSTGVIGSTNPVPPSGYTALRYYGYYAYNCRTNNAGNVYTFYKNQNPVADSYAHIVAVNSPANGMVVASDPDNDPLSFMAYGAMHGVTSINAATGAYVYTPDQNYQGTDSFFIDVSDSKGGLYTVYVGVTIELTVTVNVVVVAQSPAVGVNV